MVFSGFCFVSLRLARSIYASIISRRSPCLPCITTENPHSSFRSFQTFKTLQKKLLTNLRVLTRILKSSPRRISTGPLNTLLHLHSRPINLVFYKASY